MVMFVGLSQFLFPSSLVACQGNGGDGESDAVADGVIGAH